MKTSNYTFDDLNEEPKQNIKAEKHTRLFGYRTNTYQKLTIPTTYIS